MTESEATKVIEGHLQFLRENWKPHPDYNVIESQRMAIQAISEVQQYRAIIGLTPDDLKSLEKDEIQTIGDALKAFAEWSQYKDIGTVSELRELKEKVKAIKYELE